MCVAHAKILDLALFSSQEAFSLHFSFKLEVTNNVGSLAIYCIYVLCVRTYYSYRILLQQFSLGMRPHKSQMHNYISASVENGPAMAGPARPVPASMLLLWYSPHSFWKPDSSVCVVVSTFSYDFSTRKCQHHCTLLFMYTMVYMESYHSRIL